MPKSYAVLFKAHFWDEFTQRQFERLRANVGRGHLWILFDETLKPAPTLPYDRVIGITTDKLMKLGLPLVTTHGSILWYNTDYPHYVALAELGSYDFYITVEFDAAIRQPVDTLVDRLAADGVDYLGFPIRKTAQQWAWFPMHRDIYGPEMLVYLSCIAAFSHRAIHRLLARRQEMGRDFTAGEIPFWPNNEAFLPNEIRRAGMTSASLSQYGSTELYDWWPPTEETKLSRIEANEFVHPVLQGMRYARSLIHHAPALSSFRDRSSADHAKLSHFDPRLVRSLLRAESHRRWVDRAGRMLERLHLRRRWYSHACAQTARSVHGQSLHNAE